LENQTSLLELIKSVDSNTIHICKSVLHYTVTLQQNAFKSGAKQPAKWQILALVCEE